MKGKFIQYYNTNWQGNTTLHNGVVVSDVFTETGSVSIKYKAPAGVNGSWWGNNFTATGLGEESTSYVLTSCGSKVKISNIAVVTDSTEDLPPLPLTSAERNSIIKERVARRKAEKRDKPDV